MWTYGKIPRSLPWSLCCVVGPWIDKRDMRKWRSCCLCGAKEQVREALEVSARSPSSLSFLFLLLCKTNNYPLPESSIKYTLYFAPGPRVRDSNRDQWGQVSPALYREGPLAGLSWYPGAGITRERLHSLGCNQRWIWWQSTVDLLCTWASSSRAAQGIQCSYLVTTLQVGGVIEPGWNPFKHNLGFM
jgi:hypothetical protein